MVNVKPGRVVVDYDGDVGLWHELYKVRAGEWDTSYINMPPYGLAKATGDRPADRTSPDHEPIEEA